MQLPDRVTLIEVGLRDGLQNEPAAVNTAGKLVLAEALLSAGVAELEPVSFVHPKLVPQMADAEAVVAALAGRPGLRLAGLVPNLRGTQRALACALDELRYSVVATETYSQLNWGMSIDKSLEQVRQSLALVRASGRGMRVIGMVSAAFGCPYEGDVPAAQVLRLVEAFMGMGVDGVNLADSAGMGNPQQIQRLTAQVLARCPGIELTMHFHNTRGMAPANVLACLELGVTRFDSSVGGLGGCPFSPEAAGNICTVDTAYMLSELGIDTGLDIDGLIAAARLAEQLVGHRLPGMVYRAGKRKGFVPVGGARA